MIIEQVFLSANKYSFSHPVTVMHVCFYYVFSHLLDFAMLTCDEISALMVYLSHSLHTVIYLIYK